MTLEFRTVRREDAKALWEWRNDAKTREASFAGEPIPWEDHVRWFDESLKNRSRRIFMVQDQEREVGMVRADEIRPREFELSWMISPNCRGLGYGKRMLADFVREFPGRMIAKIKTDNVASEKMAELAGFEREAGDGTFGVWIKEG